MLRNLLCGVSALILIGQLAHSQEAGSLRIISFNSWGARALKEGNDALFASGQYDIIAIQEYQTLYGADIALKMSQLGSDATRVYGSGDKGLIHRFDSGNGQFGARNVPYIVATAEGLRPDVLVASEHLNYYDDPFDFRVGQAQELNQWPLGELRPLIIVGDFNAGDISERGLLEPVQQLLMLRNARNGSADYRAWALQYVTRNHPVGSDVYRAVESYLNRQTSALPDDLFTDETYPIPGNTPYTVNVLKKQYQLLVLPSDQEPFRPHELADGSTTWPSAGEDDEAFKWPSWGRTQIDHFFASRPYAKWWEIVDDPSDRYIGGVLDQDLSVGPDGIPFSDHEPIAHELRWRGPKLSYPAAGQVGLTFDAEVAGDGAFYLSRNNQRTDVYLGQLSAEDGTPIYEQPLLVDPLPPDFGELLAQAVYDRAPTESFRRELAPFVPADQLVVYNQYLADLSNPNSPTFFRKVIESYFQANRGEFPGITSISSMSWGQWGTILLKHIESDVQFDPQLNPILVGDGSTYADLFEALGLNDPATRARVGAATGLDFDNDPFAAFKLRLDCSDASHLALEGARALCVDDHSRFTAALITEGTTVVIDESQALGAADAVVTLDDGGLRTAGPGDLWAQWTAPISEITQRIVLAGNGWIDVSHPTVPVSLWGGVSGPGGLEKRGAGTLVMAAPTDYAGGTTVAAGRLAAGAANVFSPSSAFVVAAEGVLDLNGFNQTVSGMRNAGLISLLPAVGSPVLTVMGDYVAAGGVLLMDAALAPQGGPAQPAVLKITGNLTGGQDVIAFNSLSFSSNLGDDYLQIAEVGGSSGENFVLGERVSNGAFEYALNRRADGNWYLESAVAGSDPNAPLRLLRPEISAYGANLTGAALMFDHSLKDRVSAAFDPLGSSWLRIERLDGSLFSGPGDQFDSSFDRSTLHAGFSLGQWQLGEGEVAAGLMFGYGQQKGSSLSIAARSSAQSELEGFGLGLYATWRQSGAGEPGWYVDGWAMRGTYRGALTSAGAPDLSYDLDSTTFSLETGFSHILRQSDAFAVWVEPSLQMLWSDIGSEQLTDASGNSIDASGETTSVRLGLRTTLAGVARPSGSQMLGYVDLDFWHSLDAAEVVFAGVPADIAGGNSVRIGLGMDQIWSPGAKSSVGIGYSKGEGGSDALSLALSHKISF